MTTNHLDARIARGRPLLTCYFPLGDPLFDDAMLALYARCGVDILELGVPTLDPFMDGADVASAMRIAIDEGADIAARLAEITGWLRADAARPAGICMTYPDIDFARILDRPALDCLDGLLMPGLDGRHDADAIRAATLAAGTRLIAFVSTEPDATEIAAARATDGYVMLQARAGITGPSDLDPAASVRIAALRDAGVTQPILLGFGISSADQAAQALAMGADGVIIGSMCIRMARKGADRIEEFLADVRATLDG
ncbi:MAG TPA: tryptophan synthase subunit alpha [Sphingomonas sp.]